MYNKVYEIFDGDNISDTTRALKIKPAKYFWSAYCLGSRVPLPRTIKTQIQTKDSDNIIFECGGYDNENAKYINQCNAFIISTNDKVFKCTLPSLPTDQNYDYNGPNSFYDPAKGLFCIGGLRPSFTFNLPFDGSQDSDNWGWKILPKMRVARQWPSCIMIDTNELANNHKILAVGGYNWLYYSDVEMFDFKENKWSNVASLNS